MLRVLSMFDGDVLLPDICTRLASSDANAVGVGAVVSIAVC